MIPGTIVYAKPDPTVGREQAGYRPVLIVSSTDYARVIPELVIAVPLTSRDRELPHHILVPETYSGLKSPTWALCEQVRAISLSRLGKTAGYVDIATLRKIRTIIGRFLEL